jgi:hypothetical protein
MMTAAGIAKVLQIPTISINAVYCEWMSEKLFDHTQLKGLMLYSEGYNKE